MKYAVGPAFGFSELQDLFSPSSRVPNPIPFSGPATEEGVVTHSRFPGYIKRMELEDPCTRDDDLVHVQLRKGGWPISIMNPLYGTPLSPPGPLPAPSRYPVASISEARPGTQDNHRLSATNILERHKSVDARVGNVRPSFSAQTNTVEEGSTAAVENAAPSIVVRPTRCQGEGLSATHPPFPRYPLVMWKARSHEQARILQRHPLEFQSL